MVFRLLPFIRERKWCVGDTHSYLPHTQCGGARAGPIHGVSETRYIMRVVPQSVRDRVPLSRIEGPSAMRLLGVGVAQRQKCLMRPPCSLASSRAETRDLLCGGVCLAAMMGILTIRVNSTQRAVPLSVRHRFRQLIDRPPQW